MTSESSNWMPRFALDLRTAKPKDLVGIATEFERWQRAEPVTEPLNLTNGWHTVTPEIAEQWLRRNPPGANRKLNLATVAYYGRMMQHDNWKKTGQPVIFSTDGVLRDAQHRLYGCYLSGAPFTTYVITDVEPVPHLFAYIDNCRARNQTDQLQTTGINGLAPVIKLALHMADKYGRGCFTANSAHALPTMEPVDIIHLAEEHPKVSEAAKGVASDYNAAAKMIGDKAVATCFAMQLLELHDETVLDEFYNDLGTPSDEDQNPVAVFQDTMKKDRAKAKDHMKKHQVFGALINTFNAWFTHTAVKKVAMRVNDDFPQITLPVAQQQAAE